jgi:aspartate-semialdehyde dehydrogenase
MKIAIIGATGAVGREMVADLEDSDIQNLTLGLFASQRSAGEMISFRGKAHEVRAFDVNALRGFDYCLMSAGGAFSRQNARAIADMGVTVIDNSSAWRMVDGVLLVVPEVNGHLLKGLPRGSIVANPNCSTIQMVVALKPLYDAFGIEQIQVSTYQSVSGTGQKGIRELSAQVEAALKFGEQKPQVYAQPIAFNVLPAIDVLDGAGHCFEEEKMVRETRKIFGRSDLDILATTVRVPVYHCHCESVAVRLTRDVTRADLLAKMSGFSGLTVHLSDDHAEFPTPRSVTGDRGVHVARIRTPIDKERSHWAQFWIVADNLKKGAATNAVQILESIHSTR